MHTKALMEKKTLPEKLGDEFFFFFLTNIISEIIIYCGSVFKKEEKEALI